jgi:hypothetical protein
MSNGCRAWLSQQVMIHPGWPRAARMGRRPIGTVNAGSPQASHSPESRTRWVRLESRHAQRLTAESLSAEVGSLAWRVDIGRE